MKSLAPLAFALASLVIWLPGAEGSDPEPSETRRLLLVTQSAGFEHSTVTRNGNPLSHSERVLKEMGIRSGKFRVDCTQDVATDFKPELIKNYDVVAFYTTGKLPIEPETLDWFLNIWLAEQGHGFLGLHSAADTFKDYEPYWDMIGGSFVAHPWNKNATVAIKIHEEAHPATQAWGTAGETFEFTDEIYTFKNWQPEKVRVLMSLDMQQTSLKKPFHVPILWVKPYGNGRVMHMSLGHREDVWDNPTYQDSLIAGIGWLNGDVAADATPNPKLSAEQEELAKQAFENQSAEE